jgi:hypothetical protein
VAVAVAMKAHLASVVPEAVGLGGHRVRHLMG